MTESELSDLMALNALRDDSCKVIVRSASEIQNLKVVNNLANAVPDLVAEIRKLREDSVVLKEIAEAARKVVDAEDCSKQSGSIDVLQYLLGKVKVQP